VARLIALDLPAGDHFVAALQRAWHDGDTILPIDQRLPPLAKANLVSRFGAQVVLTEHNETSVGGWPADDGDALVVATSGSSGEPKGVVLTHDAVAASARLTSARLGIDPSRDHWLACLPMAHIGGLSVVTRSLLAGTALTVHESFDAARCEEAARNGANCVSLVVTALGRIDTGLFRLILLGGSAIPEERAANTVATYGMTETGSGVVYDGYPLDEVEIRIVDGEIEIHTPTALRLYRDGTDPFTRDGWLRTGDAGSLGSDGRLSVSGRLGDVIVTGGEKVWPQQVESEMERLPWVGEVAVVGRPDPTWGHEVTAVVVQASGCEAPGLAELRDQLSDALPRYALPRRLELAESLPRTSLGKLRRGLMQPE
jgi:o-succinylbenzoate---CoA ligase